MPIPFTCPQCGSQTLVADQYAGQSGPCSQCGKTITIPLAGQAFVPPAGQAYGPQPGQGYVPQPASRGSGTSLAVVLAIVAVVLFVCGGILVALLLPAVQAAREAARRSQCSNNLKQIGLALHNYQDQYKCFPPAATTDKDGKPMRSWRVAILPYLEQQPASRMYNEKEPWDSPNNRNVSAISIPAYRCPSDQGSPLETNYIMITGPNTLGGKPNEAVKMKDITDGTSNTIAVVEVTGLGIPWAEPRDLTVEEFLTLVNSAAGKGGASRHPGGFQVLLADGSVRFISYGTDPETLRRMLTRNDGKPVSGF